MIALIPIIGALWVMIKSGHEIYAQMKYYKAGILIEDSEAHTHQHLAVTIGFFIYALCVPLMMWWGGFTFSVEWIPLHIFVNILTLYVVEHFAIERESREAVIRFRDLFNIRKIKKVSDYEKV